MFFSLAVFSWTSWPGQSPLQELEERMVELTRMLANVRLHSKARLEQAPQTGFGLSFRECPCSLFTKVGCVFVVCFVFRWVEVGWLKQSCSFCGVFVLGCSLKASQETMLR